MEIQEAETEMCAAHAAIGGFIVRCSLLDFRVSQFMARWFCAHEKQKFLSYTLKAMPLAQKRQVIEERLKTEGAGNVKADPNSKATSVSKVFTAGDMTRGQSLIVWAIAEGRSCAAAVDADLTGSSDLPAPIHPEDRPLL